MPAKYVIISISMGGKKSNRVRRLLGKFTAVRNWQLLLILIPLLFLTATLLRFDHIRMTELRAAVVAADQANDDGAIQKSLIALQEFVFTHIVVNVVESNGLQSVVFGTGPFYLENQYLRAANAAIEEAEQNLSSDANPNGNIYAAVMEICRPLAIQNGWAWNSPGYLNCWTSELAKYPSSDKLQIDLTADVPSTELFRYNYASPLWAPTPAGFAILACLIIIFIVVLRIVIWLALKVVLFFLNRT